VTPKMRCLSCDGEYDPDQPGGYYHRCPDYRLVKKGPGGPGVEPGDPGEYADVTKIPQYQRIPEPRDENLDDRDPEKPVRPRKEGRGREPVAEEPVEKLPA